MIIRPHTDLINHYDEIADLCRSTKEPVYITQDGKMDFVIIDRGTFERREKMLQLREELLAAEEERQAGAEECLPEE